MCYKSFLAQERGEHNTCTSNTIISAIQGRLDESDILYWNIPESIIIYKFP
jgi:hypothetical protein